MERGTTCYCQGYREDIVAPFERKWEKWQNHVLDKNIRDSLSWWLHFKGDLLCFFQLFRLLNMFKMLDTCVEVFSVVSVRELLAAVIVRVWRVFISHIAHLRKVLCMATCLALASVQSGIPAHPALPQNCTAWWYYLQTTCKQHRKCFFGCKQCVSFHGLPKEHGTRQQCKDILFSGEQDQLLHLSFSLAISWNAVTSTNLS